MGSRCSCAVGGEQLATSWCCYARVHSQRVPEGGAEGGAEGGQRVAGYIFLFVLLFVGFRVATERHETTAHDGWVPPLTLHLQSLSADYRFDSIGSCPAMSTNSEHLRTGFARRAGAWFVIQFGRAGGSLPDDSHLPLARCLVRRLPVPLADHIRFTTTAPSHLGRPADR